MMSSLHSWRAFVALLLALQLVLPRAGRCAAGVDRDACCCVSVAAVGGADRCCGTADPRGAGDPELPGEPGCGCTLDDAPAPAPEPLSAPLDEIGTALPDPVAVPAWRRPPGPAAAAPRPVARTGPPLYLRYCVLTL